MVNITEKFNLKDKVAVITGGAGILGSAVAEGLGMAGCRIALCDITSTDKKIEALLDKNIEAKGYSIDVLNIDSIKICCSKILKDFNKVDVLINAAGGNLKGATTSDELSFFDIPMAALNKVIDLNLLGGAILPCQVFGKYMAKNDNGGSIINIASMAGFRPLTKTPGYSCAKAAVINFTQWLAVHFAQEYNKNLRVNAIAPGFFSTSQNRYLLFDNEGKLTGRGKDIINNTPMGRFGEPFDLAGVCIWLASEMSSFVTGAVIALDGGFNAYSGV